MIYYCKTKRNKEGITQVWIKTRTKQTAQIMEQLQDDTNSSSTSRSVEHENENTVIIKKNKLKDALSIIIAGFMAWFEEDIEADAPQYITPKVLLDNCSSVQEHYARLQSVLSMAKDRRSIDGLRAVGFDYIFVPCDKHREEHEKESANTTCTHTLEAKLKKRLMENTDDICMQCGTRLFFMETNTPITMENRQRYIADGPMYDTVVRMCQEYAQDLMQHAGSLAWVSVCEDERKGNPIRMLVDYDYPIHRGRCARQATANEYHASSQCTKPTLLITTGNGKVRGGIFSRQHLLVSSIESSTALPMVLDAKRRNLRIAILDPNARGDRNAMDTYEQSMEVLFGPSPSSSSSNNINKCNPSDTHEADKNKEGDLYILAHSASGAQLTRYIQSDGHHLFRRIKSIAFTDSNHSIQWLLNEGHSHIATFYQSPSTVYIRSTNVSRDEGWRNHQAGDAVKTDRHWHHRFGSVETVWAGTKEHSLMNWTSHNIIWSHFDKCGTCITVTNVSEEISTYDDDTNSGDRITTDFANAVHVHRNQVLTSLGGNPSKPMVHIHERIRKSDLVEGVKLEGERISVTESEREDDLSWGDSNSPLSSGLHVDENLSYGNDPTFSDDFNGELIFDDVSTFDDENNRLRRGEVDDAGWKRKVKLFENGGR